MTRRWRPSARGPGAAGGAPASDALPWWTSAPSRSASAGEAPVAQSRAVEREADRLSTLSAAAAAVQLAVDEHEVFEAIATVTERQGLSGHLAALEPSGASLVIRKTMMPCAHQAQLERIHGGLMVGARIDAGPGTAHRTAIQSRCSMHAPGPLAWAIGVAPEIGPAERDAIGALVGLGEALIVPITDERSVFGVLTVWAATLTRSDRAICEILGRLAGGALGAQRGRDVTWQGIPPALVA